MHRYRGLRLLGVAFPVMLLALDAAASPRSVELRYDVYTAGVATLALKLDLSFADGRYRIVSNMETQGVVGFLFPWRHRGEVDGAVAGDDLRPGLYRTTSAVAGKVRHARLVYRGDGTVAATAEPPPQADDREPVSPEMTHGSVDVLTAVLRVTRRMEATGSCSGEVPVFDGLRRYDLVFADAGIDRANAMTVSVVHRCSASMRRLAGFLKTLSPWDDGDDARAASIAVASLGGDLPLVPVRLDLATPVGMARAELVAVTIDGRPLPAPTEEAAVARSVLPRR